MFSCFCLSFLWGVHTFNFWKINAEHFSFGVLAFSVIFHTGRSVTEGHYFLVIKIGDKWVRYDDVIHRVITTNELERILSDETGTTMPYLLTYEAVNRRWQGPLCLAVPISLLDTDRHFAPAAPNQQGMGMWLPLCCLRRACADASILPCSDMQMHDWT